MFLTPKLSDDDIRIPISGSHETLSSPAEGKATAATSKDAMATFK